MSPDAADDASPSPEPDFDQDAVATTDIMAEERNNIVNHDRASTEGETSPAQASNGSGTEKPKSNAKDPSRPRRKKARRACFACQRAHLTCGDERPCLRCIKRGLQDQCHDGVRKKAKYLHDAPAEALIPGFHPHYHMNGHIPHVQNPTNGMPVSQGPNYFPQTTAPSYPQYAPVAQQGQMAPPLVDGNSMMGDFNPQMSTPTQYQSTPSQHVSPEQGMTTIDQNALRSGAGSQSFDAGFVDPNDQTLFNFDLSGLNFGNHYGALEFGMLGHLSSGAVGTPDVDLFSGQGSMSFDNANNQGSFGYNPSWQAIPNTGSRQSSSANLMSAINNNGLEAFAIGEHNSITGTSPHSQPGYQSSTASPETTYQQFEQKPQEQGLLQQSFHQSKRHFPSSDDAKEVSRKRRRDTSEIYTIVQEPYPYTQGFHALTALLQKRFPSNKTLRVAKALASIRPSFISCNKNLNQPDLIFMEKCFQRTLCEYEEFINCTGTPTLIFRRTGEIAAVSQEFSLLTGWRRDVLLGKEPNLNVNFGSDGTGASGSQTGASTRGAATPKVSNVDIDNGRPQPVFLAEIMDQDSVVRFYENFAELAFGAASGSIIGDPCYLLKYKTKDDEGWGPDGRINGENENCKEPVSSKPDALMRGNGQQGSPWGKDGKIDCMMCWSIKRDVFDIPMLIVMNFLPNMWQM
ncbi:hypothetical protein K431DRAFT_119502 [Polychaeton citri CBS 116435]|uniref:Zn(2)-C6 fungal-type domain-containing protein n=1 Tax=Polychaeton citri CBS 116435 TaxID=1314669 RepID=A0A9P4UKM4_9PEZI|nr:hypothetical protein K431DRAFT_119502 [Polychaeton citri CBS 116435]